MPEPARAVPRSFRDPTYDTLDRDVEKRLGLPAGLLSDVRTKGERSNADQVSGAGARSVYQIIPATRAAVQDKYGVDAYAGPEQAALAAGYVLKEGLDRNRGNRAAAVAEYHGGTDRRNHGPRTEAYAARVTGGDTPKPSTYDRVRAARQAEDGPSLTKVYVAYRSGKMSPEQAAQFEHDVNAGSILLPRGASLKKTPSAPVLPAGVIRAYNDMNSGMTIEQRQQIDADMRDGVVSAPRAAKLKPWRPMTTGEEARRGMGLSTRSIIEGVGDVAGIVMNPLNAAINATGIPQKLTGAPLPLANDPAVNIPDMLGLPKPQFDSERTMNAVGRGATGGLVTYGMGSLAGAAPGVTGMVGRAVASAPVTDVVSGATAGGSAELARQEGFGPVGQTVAGLIGGGVGVAGAMAGERVAARAGRQAAELPATTPRDVVIDSTGDLTEEGQELVARHGFTPAEIKQAYDSPEPVTGTTPAAQATKTQPTLPGRDGEASPAGPAVPAETMVRRHEGVDYPVDVLGTEQTDATGRVHVQVRGVDTGAVGFVPKDELFPAPSPAANTARPADLPAMPDIQAATSVRTAHTSSGSARTAAERARDAEALGFPLTRGQATQDWATQDAEQTLRAQASGEGDKARGFLVEQADKIKAAVTRMREAFGPTDATRTERGQIVKDALRELRDRGRAGINALYREAEAMGGGALPLKSDAIVDAAKRVLVEADVTPGVKDVVRQEMARYGLLGKDAVTAEDGLTTVKLTDGRKVQFYGSPETLTVANAEAFRQAISAQYKVDGPRKLSQAIKGAIDDAVEAEIEAAARSDVSGPVGAKLKEARHAVVAQKEIFSAKDVVQRLVDWRKNTKTDLVLPDHAMREVFSGETSNLKRLKAVLLSNPTDKSKSAWRAVQAEALGHLFEKAYILNSNLGGGALGSISGAKLNSEIVRFGIPKLKLLLDEDDFGRLMSLRRSIGEATIPIQNTTNPSGSAFKMMRFLTPMAAKLSGIPLAGPAFDVASGLVKQARATAQAERTLQGMTRYTASTAAEDAAAPSARAPLREQAAQAADGLVRELVEVARSGRLTPSVIASTVDPRPAAED